MSITLPHWAVIVVVVLGSTFLGLAQVGPLAPYSPYLTAIGGFLVAGGLRGALVLPSVEPAANVAAVAKLPRAVSIVQDAVDKASLPS